MDLFPNNFPACDRGIVSLDIAEDQLPPLQNVRPNLTREVVPDEVTAVSLAEKEFVKVYGKKKVESERPFKAVLANGVWHVSGIVHCRDANGNAVEGVCPGGTAEADIRQSDGRILRVIHMK